MDRNEIDRVKALLPTGKTLFHYFRDRYALMLLGWALRGGARPVCELRHSRFRSLLDKEPVRLALARAGSGQLGSADVESIWPVRPEVYRLTLGRWGSASYWNQTWHQTSRPGQNLVLRLNFTGGHDRALRRAFGRGVRFDSPLHPGSRTFNTLAWSRIDLSLAHREALIEEVQSDWVRYARQELAWAKSLNGPRRRLFMANMWGDAADLGRAEHYVKHVLAPHARVWDEAMLAATLWMLVELLDVRRVYLHTLVGGCVMKRCGLPPRSIYEHLPRRFCFRPTAEAPRFLAETRHRRVRRALGWGPGWWLLRV